MGLLSRFNKTEADENLVRGIYYTAAAEDMSGYFLHVYEEMLCDENLVNKYREFGKVIVQTQIDQARVIIDTQSRVVGDIRIVFGPFTPVMTVAVEAAKGHSFAVLVRHNYKTNRTFFTVHTEKAGVSLDFVQREFLGGGGSTTKGFNRPGILSMDDVDDMFTAYSNLKL